MDEQSPKYKVKAGLKMITSVMYNFYLHIEGLSLEELRRSKSNYRQLIQRKNKKGINVRIDLALFDKVHRKLNPLKQSINKGQLEIIANSHQNFSIYFNMKINKRSLKKVGASFKVDLNHSLKDYYNIAIEYHCNKEMLDILERDYYKKQIESNNSPEKNNNKLEVQKELNDMWKREKGITKTTKSSFKKCINCYYNNKGKCGLWGLSVKKNEVCKHFYAPKVRVYSGGGFSPR